MTTTNKRRLESFVVAKLGQTTMPTSGTYYNSSTGVVSLNDVLERIVGELPGELAAARHLKVRRREDGTWLVDAVLHIEQFRQAIGMTTPLPEEGTGRFTTLSGFLQRTLGRLPEEGDVVNVAGLSFEVVDMDGHRVDKLIVTKKA